MRTHRKPLRALQCIAAAGASLALLASCGGSGGSSDGAEPTPSNSGTLTVDVLKSVLLSGADLGGDFQAGPASDTASPLPCAARGARTLDQQAPPALQARTVLLSPSLTGEISEQLKVYDNDAAASAALAIYVAGFACATGSLYGADGTTEPLAIVGPSDVTANVGVSQVDGVIGWGLTSTAVDGLAIVSQFGASLMFLTFLNPTGADPAKYPDSLQVVQAALAKIVNS